MTTHTDRQKDEDERHERNFKVDEEYEMIVSPINANRIAREIHARPLESFTLRDIPRAIEAKQDFSDSTQIMFNYMKKEEPSPPSKVEL